MEKGGKKRVYEPIEMVRRGENLLRIARCLSDTPTECFLILTSAREILKSLVEEPKDLKEAEDEIRRIIRQFEKKRRGERNGKDERKEP